MTSKQSRTSQATDRLMNMEGIDEREERVFNQATTFGLMVGSYTSLAVALVAAVFGAIALPIGLLAMMGLPTWAAQWYAGRQGVSLDELADKASAKQRLIAAGVVVVGILLTVGAMAWTVFTGQGLIPLPKLEFGPDATGATASAVRGGVIGAAIGVGLAATWVLVGTLRRKRKPASEIADEEDFD
ncbi:hypothetical protein GCM10028820_00590 [Tessaracoccus terricola]